MGTCVGGMLCSDEGRGVLGSEMLLVESDTDVEDISSVSIDEVDGALGDNSTGDSSTGLAGASCSLCQRCSASSRRKRDRSNSSSSILPTTDARSRDSSPRRWLISWRYWSSRFTSWVTIGGGTSSGSGDSSTDSETAVLRREAIDGLLLTLVDIVLSETTDGVGVRRGATMGRGSCAGENACNKSLVDGVA